MKSFNRKTRILVSGIAMGLVVTGVAAADEEQLVGRWNCDLTFEDADFGAAMTGTFAQSYRQDGTYERAGKMRIVVAAFDVDAAFAVAESGDWRSDGKVITELRSKLEFTADDPSPAAQLVIQQMQAEADAENVAEESVDITKLTTNELEFEDPDGAEAVCRRA